MWSLTSPNSTSLLDLVRISWTYHTGCSSLRWSNMSLVPLQYDLGTHLQCNLPYKGKNKPFKASARWFDLTRLNDWQVVFSVASGWRADPVTVWFYPTKPATLLFVPVMSRLHKPRELWVLPAMTSPAHHLHTQRRHCASIPTNAGHTSPLTSRPPFFLHSNRLKLLHRSNL